MNGLTSAFLVECEHLAHQKNFDYHPDRVAYLEILQTAFETGITVEQDLWGRIRKQMSALRRYVIDGKLESESPRSRMMDVVNYMAILAVWDANRAKILFDARHFIEEHRPCDLSSHSDDIPCDRCQFLAWLRSHTFVDLVSKEPQSLQTLKPLG